MNTHKEDRCHTPLIGAFSITHNLVRVCNCDVTFGRYCADKCEFAKAQVKFLGHIIDQNGV